MRLGLLQCDHVRPEFLSIAGDYDEMFARWLPGDWRVYDLTAGARPARLDECDAYVSTGSKSSVYDDDPWIHGFAGLVRELHTAAKPFLGVCFGHQMMGHALGGRVAKSPKGWGIGVHTFQVQGVETWMRPPEGRFRALMSCQDQVEVVPPGAEVLASNDHCAVGMFRAGTLLGIQGHPEFTPAYARALLEFRRERIGAEPVQRALATLETPLDAGLLAGWVLDFFHQGSVSRPSA